MKTRLSRRPLSSEESRSAAPAHSAARPLQAEPAAAMPDARASALAQLKHQALASSSSQAAQLKARADLMAAGSADAPVQRVEDEDILQGKFAAQGVEDEELLQGKFEAVQRVEEEPLQGKFEALQRREAGAPVPGQPAHPAAPLSFAGAPAQREEKPNDTGLPGQLKCGIESLSGLSMDHVKVHYNSAKPSQLHAHAYAQGNEIHLAPGQETHLPHEAWHVVQQSQGRVKPTVQLAGGVGVNDDASLEHEADVMGAKAVSQQFGASGAGQPAPARAAPSGLAVQRRALTEAEETELGKLAGTLQDLQASYARKMIEIEQILAIVPTVPVDFRYLANRMDSTLRPLADFLAESIEMGTRHPSSARTLQRVRARHTWYTKSASGEPLVQATLDDAKSRKPRLEALVHVGRIEQRGAIFTADRYSVMSSREKRLTPTSVSEIDTAHTDALRNDPDASVGAKGWRQVEDAGAPAENKTKFLNMFHPQSIVMLENYRARSKGYYASDVLFDQWMRATGVDSLLELPRAFPRHFYRNHIENEKAKVLAERLQGKANAVWVDSASDDWPELAGTDNVKSTLNILAEYNRINLARGERQFKCLGLMIYAGPTLKFEFGPQ